MTLIVAGNAVVGRNQLSELGRAAISLIDGGLEWVDWAGGESIGNYDFADESVLANAVQQGLHGTPYALLVRSGVLIGPVKLMTMDPGDLRVLAQFEATSAPDPALSTQLQTILSRYGIIAQSGFNGIKSQLNSFGVATAPVFQALSLDDLLRLFPLLDMPAANGSAPTLSTDAATFAVEQGRTPAEFADYYQAYVGYVTRLGIQGESTTQRNQMATTAMQTLLPLMFGYLDCPEVGGLVAPAEVAKAVQFWLQRGKPVGFARLSEAVSCIMRYSNYTGGNADQAMQTITDYMSSWRSFLAANPPTRGTMAQDGASCVFAVEQGGLQGELLLGPEGVITTRMFRKTPPPPGTVPVTSPSKGASTSQPTTPSSVPVTNPGTSA